MDFVTVVPDNSTIQTADVLLEDQLVSLDYLTVSLKRKLQKTPLTEEPNSVQNVVFSRLEETRPNHQGKEVC